MARPLPVKVTQYESEAEWPRNPAPVELVIVGDIPGLSDIQDALDALEARVETLEGE